jgi:hypothetical protein
MERPTARDLTLLDRDDVIGALPEEAIENLQRVPFTRADNIDELSNFRKADRVFHQKFGYGEILSMTKVTVDFEKIGQKVVAASWNEPKARWTSFRPGVRTCISANKFGLWVPNEHVYQLPDASFLSRALSPAT